MNGQNNTQLMRGLSVLIVLASTLWSTMPAAVGRNRGEALIQPRTALAASRAATNTYNQIQVIAAGFGKSCGVREDSLYCWGSYRSIPDQVFDGGVTAVSSSWSHTCAIKSGALYCWGQNDAGQLGDGTRTNRSEPVRVAGMDSSVSAVATARRHTCAIKSGKLYCWGKNDLGQLGDGTTVDKLTPVEILSGGVSAVSAGTSHTCAIQNGSLYCWGNNIYGQLGNGTYSTRLTPSQVQNMNGGVTSVSANDYYSCAIKNGALYCWGSNAFGQLGDGSTSGYRNVPAQVSTMSSGVTYISAGHRMACAVKNGVLYCWGSGPLGNGDTTSRTPVQVNGLSGGVTAVAVSSGYDQHVLALKSDGCLYAWGNNSYGQLGNGSYTDSNTPVAVYSPCLWDQPGGPDSSFSKSAPSHEALGLPTAITLRWVGFNGTNHYRYCVSNTPNCTPDVNTGNNRQVSLNLNPGIYYWQVRACLDNVCSNFVDANNGNHWSFGVSPFLVQINRSRSEVPANRAAYSIITATLERWSGEPAYSIPIQFTTNRPDADLLTPQGGDTNRNGQFALRVASREAGNTIITLTSSLYPGLPITRTSIRFIQSVSSTLSANPAYVKVGERSLLELKLLDEYGSPLSNKSVALFSSRPQDIIAPFPAQTDRTGKATVEIRTTLTGTAVVTVHNLTDNIVVPLTTTVTFVPTNTRSIVAHVFAVPEVVTVGVPATIQVLVRDAVSGEPYFFYPVAFDTERSTDNLTIIDSQKPIAELRATVSGTAVITAIDQITRLPIGRTEVKVVGNCPYRPVISAFVPSMVLGTDVVYPHLPFMPIPLDSDVTVDWRGCEPGKIVFALSNGKRVEIGVSSANTETVKTYYALRSFELNKHLPIGVSELAVEAHTKDGLVSAPYRVTIQAGEVPWWLVWLFGHADPEDFTRPELLSGSIITGAPLFAIARIWPNPGGWKFEPRAVTKKIPNTQYTDEQGERLKEAESLIKEHTTKLMLRGSMNFWPNCDMPPTLMFQAFGSKKRIAEFGPFTIGGMMNLNITAQADRNYMCDAFVRGGFNNAFYRQFRGSGSLSVDLYTEYREPVIKFFTNFIPPVRGWYYAICDNEVFKVVSNQVIGIPVTDFNACDKALADILGEIYAKIGLTLKTGMKFSLGTREQPSLDLLEYSGEVGPKIAAGYEGALLGGLIYVNAEGNAVATYQGGSSRPVPMAELAPLSKLRINAEAFLTFNVANLWHFEPKYSFQYQVDISQLIGTSNLLNIFGPLNLPPQTNEHTLKLIPPANGTPRFSGFDLPSTAQAFAQASLLSPQSTLAASSSTVTTVLASGYLTYSQTSLAHDPASGRSLLVWTQDDPNGVLGGSRELFYSLWDGTRWSQPQAITSDRVHDFSPKVSWLDSNKAIVVWTRLRDQISNAASSGISKMEIAYAVYDASTGHWSSVQNLTDDNEMDYNPVVGRDSTTGRALAAWISVESDGSSIEVVFFDENGQVIRRTHVVQAVRGIEQVVVAYHNNKAALAFTRVSRDNNAQNFTSKLFFTIWQTNSNTWLNPVELGRVLDQQNDSRPALAFDELGRTWLMFNRTGLIERREDTDGDGEPEVVGHDKVSYLVLDNPFDTQAANLLPLDGHRVLDLRLMNTSRGLMAFMLAEVAGQIDLYALVADRGHINWSKPISLIRDLASETSVDAQVGSSGELQAAYIRTNYQAVTVTTEVDGTVFTTTKRQPVGTDLIALSRIFGTLPDPVISSQSITVTFNGTTPSSTAVVSVTVANEGEGFAEPFTVSLYEGTSNARLIGQTAISLAAGFSQTIGFTWTIPAADATDLYVVLDAGNELTELNELNNTALLSVLGPDLILKGLHAFVEEGGVLHVQSLLHSIGSTATAPGMITVTISLSDSTPLDEYADQVPPIEPGRTYTAHNYLFIGDLPSGTYSVTVSVQMLDKILRGETVINLLPNLAFESESLDATDLTVPLIRVEGLARNTSQFTATNVLVAVFDPARTIQTSLVASTTIPLIRPGERIPVSLLVKEPMLCGLSVWLNPYGLPGTFAEQRLSDNVLYKSGSEQMCTRAGYELSTREGIAPLTVVFTNTSTLNTTSWEWDFGDGVTSTERNPGVHIYTQPGAYTVTLRVTSPYTSTFWQEPMTIRVYEPAVADFDSNKRIVMVGEVVSFTNRSTGDITTYSWDFGDGNTSSSQEPTHIYDRPGRYTIVLSVSGPGGRDTITKTEYIFVYGSATSVTLTATPAIIFANGISQSVVLATVRDAFGNPVPDAQVNFLAGIGRFSPASGTTDANGQATARLTSLVPGTENVFATVETLVAQTPVTYHLPPASQSGLNGSSIVATRTLGAVRKNDLITYTLTITNNGNGTVTDILMVAPIPNGTTYMAGSASGGDYVGSYLNNIFGPQAVQNVVVWSGSLAPGAAHTLSYVVQVAILEGQIINQPRVFVNNEDAGINLGSMVQVESRKAHIPIVRRR